MPNFFSTTREKVYIVVSFVVARYLLGFLNHANVAARIPYFVNMILAAIDLVVSLPMKIVFATPALKGLLRYQISLLVLFAVMIAYWYLFACILVYVYDTLNMQDSGEPVKSERKQSEHSSEEHSGKHEETQAKLF